MGRRWICGSFHINYGCEHQAFAREFWRSEELGISEYLAWVYLQALILGNSPWIDPGRAMRSWSFCCSTPTAVLCKL